ncbi:dual specificity protein phosphatase PHS1-like isoform X1 [Zingiber officinale]|uniref:dual specificity protein phosphatase PHS1-like isoform X1 n=1 Tax=Zingiber officinale TaxID=94328 RepID=UPI001C4CFDF0|nr:dual specificity protein phosphatase PHS1-like isoform X1 [Zingiber officinale]
MAEEERKEENPCPPIITPKESDGEKEYSLSSRVSMFGFREVDSSGCVFYLFASCVKVISLLWGDLTGSAQAFERWVALVRNRSGKFRPSGFPHRHSKFEATPGGRFSFDHDQSTKTPHMRELSHNLVNAETCVQSPEMSLWERLGNASNLDIESNDFSWDALSSLHHTEHTSSSEHSEDEMNKAMEVTVNSGGVVFFALFNRTADSSLNEAAAVIKIASSRLATQSERLGYEFAKWIGVGTPQARVIHNSSPEWHQIKVATENARDAAVAAGDEVGELTCSELLEALELSRCLFLMNYVHGSPLLESSNVFQMREAALKAAGALGRVLMLDLVLRNEDRLPSRQLGWRGNYANLLIADKVTSESIDAFYEDVFCASSYAPQVTRFLQRERRSNSTSGISEPPCQSLDEVNEVGERSLKKEIVNDDRKSEFHVVAIDSGVPRRPPAGKRAKDQERYPKLVELLLNSFEYSSSLLYELSGGRLGHPGPDEGGSQNDSCSSLDDRDTEAAVHEFRGGFRAALRDLQSIHVFLLTLYQKLDGLLRVYLSIISKSSGESERDETGTLDSPSHLSGFALGTPSPAIKHQIVNDVELNDPLMQKSTPKSSPPGSRGSPESASPISRDWNGRNFKGSEESRGLRLTMKLRDFHKLGKVDAELNKEIDQWNGLLRTDVVKFCQEKNFNTGFFEGNDNNIVVDAYELKVRLEHILERIALISDAASTERPSLVTSNLFVGGALAARSKYTLQHLGITHILCLCSNEIGQSDSQYPDLFQYKNFSISDEEDTDISNIFEEASDYIDYVERYGGKVLVHCFEGKSRSATVVLSYLMLRKGYTLSEAWSKLKRVHKRAQPNDGFAKILLDLDRRIHGKISMNWQHKRPVMKVCPICGKNAGLSTSSLKLHLQKIHRSISTGSVDSAVMIEIQKAVEALKISRGNNISPNRKQFTDRL